MPVDLQNRLFKYFTDTLAAVMEQGELLSLYKIKYNRKLDLVYFANVVFFYYSLYVYGLQKQLYYLPFNIQ